MAISDALRIDEQYYRAEAKIFLNLLSIFRCSVSAYMCGGGEKDCRLWSLLTKGKNVVLVAGNGYNSPDLREHEVDAT